jgi:hypothetical protein
VHQEPTTEATRIAVEFLTLWIQPEAQARAEATAYIEQRLSEPGTPPIEEVLAGHLNLARLLLFRCAVQESNCPDDLFRDVQAILQQMSPSLPEDP